jgi:hypothetical protein
MVVESMNSDQNERDLRTPRSAVTLHAMSAPSTTVPQQINVADLQLPQLAEVKRQLEEVKPLRALPQTLLGALSPDQLFRSTEASAVKIPVVH